MMDKLTRRIFFKQASVSIATTGMLAAAPTLTTVVETPEAPAAAEVAATVVPETLVAHIRDFASGEVGLMVGTQEIIYRDTELVARLLRAIQ
jgi:hypothetical protein